MENIHGGPNHFYTSKRKRGDDPKDTTPKEQT
nr:MAG TPA: hypothetical protein [Caudoviricetes sp.]